MQYALMAQALRAKEHELHMHFGCSVFILAAEPIAVPRA